MSAEEDEYKALFVSGTGGTGEACARRLKERGLTGRLRGTRLRSVAWKVLLEILPPYVPVAEWPARITAARAEYAALCEKHSVDPHAAEAAADPLSQDAESPWNRYFLNEELKKEINRDLERTYPEHEFFQTDATRANLNRILFVYSREHPEPSYRQVRKAESSKARLSDFFFFPFFPFQKRACTSCWRQSTMWCTPRRARRRRWLPETTRRATRLRPCACCSTLRTSSTTALRSLQRS